SLAGQGDVEIAGGKWPSRRSSEKDDEVGVTDADYWKGKEMEELFAAADAVSEREPLFEKARLVFVEQLGDAGEGVLRTQLAKIGKKPEEIDRTDSFGSRTVRPWTLEVWLTSSTFRRRRNASSNRSNRSARSWS